MTTIARRTSGFRKNRVTGAINPPESAGDGSDDTAADLSMSDFDRVSMSLTFVSDWPATTVRFRSLNDPVSEFDREIFVKTR